MEMAAAVQWWRCLQAMKEMSQASSEMGAMSFDNPMPVVPTGQTTEDQCLGFGFRVQVVLSGLGGLGIV